MISTLPEEIIVLILSYLSLPHLDPINESRQNDHEVATALATLAALSRTTRALHRLVEPVLYASYPGPRHADPQLFLAALASRPRRAFPVLKLVLEPPHPEDEQPEFNEYGYHEYDYDGRDLLPAHLDGGLNRLGNTAVDSGFETIPEGPHAPYSQFIPELHAIIDSYLDPSQLRDDLRIKLEAGSSTAVQSLLLLMCRNIRVLDIVAPGPDEMFSLTLANMAGEIISVPRREDLNHSSTIRPTRAYGALNRIVIRETALCHTRGFCYDSSQLVRLKGIRFATLRNVWLKTRIEPLRSDIDPALTTSSLTTMELHDCRFKRDTLACLLRSCPALTSLVIKFFGVWRNFFYIYSAGEIGAALQCIAERLEHFTLDTRSNDSDPTSHVGTSEALNSTIEHSIGDLKCFTALKTISVTANAIAATPQNTELHQQGLIPYEVSKGLVDVLPTSLQSLTLLSPARDPNWALTMHDTYPKVRDLMESPSFAALSTVCLESPSGYVSLQEHEATALSDWTFDRQGYDGRTRCVYRRQ
ncbi:hypothetical protein DOTSEDRAFT_79005 [Dothistroma septosporum NZE10]|uniref:F-box domain-containing protein n=1 Tax=Dothistroma septosporum (strain NZE10 / CBS 128990) TaxID=675120 RepID=N1PXF1_DOTSN|nr:hypothetical protein DOTSEDRAFT_79005 [Dothistroma septosporum NZE10]